jgi:glycogen debranching enzyme
MATETTSSGKEVSGLSYTYAVERLKDGHSYGNKFCYVTLDGKTDLTNDRSTARYGLRESTNQKYYLLGWEVGVAVAGGESLVPGNTTFTSGFQETRLELGSHTVRKKFFLPFENNYLRSAHFLLESVGAPEQELVVKTRMVFPKGTRIDPFGYKGTKCLTVWFPDGSSAILWGSGGIQSFQGREVAFEGKRYGDLGSAGGFEPTREQVVEVNAEFKWTPTPDTREFALSFVYTLEKSPAARGYLLNALFNDYASEPPNLQSHLFRVHQLLDETNIAINRYLEQARLWTPDPLIDRAAQWAKVNQLRLQQESDRGACFTNDPPSDTTVGRDSVWYLMGSSYYAQSRSRKLLDAWFRFGLEPSGKFIEYFTASREPIYRDDYGLNIGDTTPLMIMAAHHYYSLTGDRDFLQAVYPSLLNSTGYILEQTKVGENNHFGLVWCTSTDTFVRGLPVWRNAIPKCNIAGAPTELNVECYRALLLTAELAKVMGDEPNRARFESAAQDIRNAIEKHLRSRSPSNPYYYLNINPEGEPVADVTGDIVFPVLCGVAESATSKAILNELFSERFWAATNDGAGGIRSVSAAQGGKWGYQPKALPPGSDPNWNYGLLGGVWPNLAMWAARAAAAQGLPELSLKALRATYLLNEREHPAFYNVVPGEFNGYCNGDDLIHKEMPLSPFLPGIFIWSSIESFLGISPHAAGLEVNPSFPEKWKWVAVTNMPYRGYPLSMLAVRDERTLYTTVEVACSWKQVIVPGALQDKFTFQSNPRAFWLVIPSRAGREVVAASAAATTGKLIDRETGRTLITLTIPPGELVRKQLP